MMSPFYLTVLLVIVSGGRSRNNGKSTRTSQASGTFHLEMLKNDVTRIKTSLLSPPFSPNSQQSRTKRSTSTQFKADELMLHSLSSYCQGFNSDPDIKTYFEKKASKLPLKSRDISGFTSFTSREFPRSFDGTPEQHTPTVFPTRVTAQRFGHDVWLVFDVAHSENAIAARIDNFNFTSTTLKKEENTCNTIVSKTRFSVPVPDGKCKYSTKAPNDNRKEASFLFTPDRDYKLNRGIDTNIYVDLEICNFDKRKEYKSYAREYIWETKKEVIESEDIVNEPMFSFLSVHEFINSDFNEYHDQIDSESFDIGFSFEKGETNFTVSVILWSYDSKHDLDIDGDEKENVEHYYLAHISLLSRRYDYNTASKLLVTYDDCKVPNTCARSDIFSIEILNRTNVNNYDSRKWRVRVRFGALAQNRPGRLVVSELRKKSNSWTGYDRSELVTSVRFEASVPIRPRFRYNAQETTKAFLYPQTSVPCPVNKQCVVKCEAIGPDTQSVYVTKQPPIRGQVMSTSYRLPSKTIAILDISQSRLYNAGDLICTLVDKKGFTKTSKVKVYVGTPPVITIMDRQSLPDDEFLRVRVNVMGYGEYFKFFFYGSENQYNFSLIYSFELVNGSLTAMTYNASMNITRVDAKSGFEIVALIPWRKLRLPIINVHAEVRGEVGSSMDKTEITEFKQNRFGVYPKIDVKSLQIVEDTSNGSVTFKCNATGAQPIDFEFGYGFFYDRTIFTESNTITVERHGNVTIGSMTVDFSEIEETLNLVERGIYRCYARNKYANAEGYYPRDSFSKLNKLS